MSKERYARPVLSVADIERSIGFCVKQPGFALNWRQEKKFKIEKLKVKGRREEKTDPSRSFGITAWERRGMPP